MKHTLIIYMLQVRTSTEGFEFDIYELDSGALRGFVSGGFSTLLYMKQIWRLKLR